MRKCQVCETEIVPASQCTTMICKKRLCSIDCAAIWGKQKAVTQRKKAQRKANLQYKYWGYPELFCERPHGSFLRAHLDAQIAAGIAGQMILYRYDFFDIDQPQANALKPAGATSSRSSARRTMRRSRAAQRESAC